MNEPQFPQIIEVSEFCEKTMESVRIVLIQHSIDRFILVLEGLKGPDFIKYYQIRSPKHIVGKEAALIEYKWIIFQLSQVYQE